jgi:hypothetical protein
MRFIAAAHPLHSDGLTAAAAHIVRSCRTCGRWRSSRPPVAGSCRTAIARFEQSRGAVAAGEADAGLLAAWRATGHQSGGFQEAEYHTWQIRSSSRESR